MTSQRLRGRSSRIATARSRSRSQSVTATSATPGEGCQDRAECALAGFGCLSSTSLQQEVSFGNRSREIHRLSVRTSRLPSTESTIAQARSLLQDSGFSSEAEAVVVGNRPDLSGGAGPNRDVILAGLVIKPKVNAALLPEGPASGRAQSGSGRCRSAPGLARRSHARLRQSGNC